jgi:hypothetical protein
MPDADRELTELLADLQAGLLDDDDAARVRRRVREDPKAADALEALNRVRRDLAATDTAPAADPPPGVTERIAGALRSTDGAAHAARPRIRPARLIAGAAGLCALVAAIGVGTTALVRAPGPVPSAPETIRHITVSTPPPAIPLSPDDINALLHRSPDYGAGGGALVDPARRASCLSGLGLRASTQLLGAQPLEINHRSVVLLVVPGDTPDRLAAFAVAPTCNAADTGLLASTQVPRA